MINNAAMIHGLEHKTDYNSLAIRKQQPQISNLTNYSPPNYPFIIPFPISHLFQLSTPKMTRETPTDPDPETTSQNSPRTKPTDNVHVTITEQTPLLSGGPHHTQGHSSSAADDEEASLLPGEVIADDEQVEEKKRRGAGWYIWRVLTFAVTTFLLFVFIKGWIDGDVDVRLFHSFCDLMS